MRAPGRQEERANLDVRRRDINLTKRQDVNEIAERQTCGSIGGGPHATGGRLTTSSDLFCGLNTRQDMNLSSHSASWKAIMAGPGLGTTHGMPHHQILPNKAPLCRAAPSFALEAAVMGF